MTRKVTVHYINDPQAPTEQATLIDGNLLAFDYPDMMYFRIIVRGYVDGNQVHLDAYKVVELDGKVPTDRIEQLTLLEYIRKVAR
ncbi:hypothetical protein [Rossellomorea aquimaris]|uniref:hypothetical protein n=1 Tax=Rossellomorea aquimaris TaxID=189382 RepID=UPI001CFEAEED|nr:hypothetical protein [Rossellomorea aquimaris]